MTKLSRRATALCFLGVFGAYFALSLTSRPATTSGLTPRELAEREAVMRGQLVVPAALSMAQDLTPIRDPFAIGDTCARRTSPSDPTRQRR